MFRRPEYNMLKVGKNLRYLRQRKGYTVEEVRDYLFLGSVQAVYKYEQGKSYPPADVLFALADLYGAELGDIIKDSKETADAVSFPVYGSLDVTNAA